MFICGNDENAKKTVAQILDQFGWDTEDMGAIEAARPLRRSACCGAFPASERTTGRRTRSSFCGDSWSLAGVPNRSLVPIFESCGVARQPMRADCSNASGGRP